jgi:hypothetical protein
MVDRDEAKLLAAVETLADDPEAAGGELERPQSHDADEVPERIGTEESGPSLLSVSPTLSVSTTLNEMGRLQSLVPQYDKLAQSLMSTARLSSFASDGQLHRQLTELDRLTRSIKQFQMPNELAGVLGGLQKIMSTPVQQFFADDLRRLMPDHELTAALRNFQTGLRGTLGLAHDLNAQLGRSLSPALHAMNLLASQLPEVVPQSDVSRWLGALHQMAVPHFATIARDYARPIGVLSVLDDATFLSWAESRHDHDEPTMVMAALVPSRPETARTRRLEVNCSIVCSLCRGPMLMKAESEIVSEDEVEIALRVFPFCPDCTRRAADDPSFWFENLRRYDHSVDAAKAPAYDLVEGDCAGDGVPRGILRLVEVEDEE